MPRQPTAMILVRVAQQKGIDIWPAVLVFFSRSRRESLATSRTSFQDHRHLADVYVDQQGRRVKIAELDECHVPVVDGKKVMVVGIEVSG